MNILDNAYGDTIEARLRYIGATDIKKNSWDIIFYRI